MQNAFFVNLNFPRRAEQVEVLFWLRWCHLSTEEYPIFIDFALLEVSESWFTAKYKKIQLMQKSFKNQSTATQIYLNHYLYCREQ
jgi:hypothetical protein